MAQCTTKTAEDLIKIINLLHKKKENFQCFECLEKGTTYIVVNLGTFVCAKCAGIIRELNYFVKGIGLSNFKETEVKFLKEMGNENAKKVWLAKFNPDVNKYPHPRDLIEIKNHIKEKYIEKKYYEELTSENLNLNQFNQETKHSKLKKNEEAQINPKRQSTLNEVRTNNTIENLPKKSDSSKNVLRFPLIGNSSYNSSNNLAPQKKISNDFTQSVNQSNNSNTLNLSDISMLNSSMYVNYNQNSEIKSKIDFITCDQTLSSENKSNIQFDFTRQTNNSNIINNINKFYAEKKEDPLDKLLQQHISFNNSNIYYQQCQLNNSRISSHYNQINQMNHSNINTMYGYDFF